jgi:two-component system response regulator BaeR
MNKPRILVVEDEAKIGALLSDYLTHAGYDPLVVADGNVVMAALRDWHPDAVLLDVMLPGKDGLTLCREIRAQTAALPILMVTARAEEIDRLLGLELGADDYIVKPFSPREVVARVKAVLRRSQGVARGVAESAPGSSFLAGGFALDESRLAVSWRGEQAVVTLVEFQLLACLAKDPGRIWSRQQLMDRIYTDHRVVSDRTIDSHVKKLRRKLDDAFPGTELVQSVYGAGYRFELPD